MHVLTLLKPLAPIAAAPSLSTLASAAGIVTLNCCHGDVSSSMGNVTQVQCFSDNDSADALNGASLFGSSTWLRTDGSDGDGAPRP